VEGFTGFSSPAVSAVACAKKDGFYCWGSNGYGQIGIGQEDTADHPSPASVTVVTGAKTLTTGYDHSCAIDGNGDAFCWGFNFWGTIGDGTVGGVACEGGQKWCSLKAVKVRGLSHVVAISGGGDFTLAMTNDGAVWAWGANTDGRNGHTPNPAASVDGGPPDNPWDGGPADISCFPGSGGGPCGPSPSRVLGLP
jgi:alpha-tubulin suppressor-like RCC1 family protein